MSETIQTTFECRTLGAADLLALLPHRAPFRFIDEITEIDDEHIVGRYRFREDEFFYTGHFPGNAITPGVILLETLAQIGVVALFLYLGAKTPSIDERNLTILFADAQVEFTGVVCPGERVTVSARKLFFRRNKLKVTAEMQLENGTVVCGGELSGWGQRRK